MLEWHGRVRSGPTRLDQLECFRETAHPARLSLSSGPHDRGNGHRSTAARPVGAVDHDPSSVLATFHELQAILQMWRDTPVVSSKVDYPEQPSNTINAERTPIWG